MSVCHKSGHFCIYNFFFKIKDVPEFQNKIRRQKYNYLFIHPVQNLCPTAKLLTPSASNRQVLVGARVNLVDGGALAAPADPGAGPVLLVPEQEGDTVARVLVADVAGQQGSVPVLVRQLINLQ